MRITDGNIFEGMRIILPEHRELMHRAERERQKVKHPILGEDQLEEMSRVLSQSMIANSMVELTLYDPFENKILRLYPQRIDQVTQRLIAEDPFSNKEYIALQDILDVRIVNKGGCL